MFLVCSCASKCDAMDDLEFQNVKKHFSPVSILNSICLRQKVIENEFYFENARGFIAKSLIIVWSIVRLQNAILFSNWVSKFGTKCKMVQRWLQVSCASNQFNELQWSLQKQKKNFFYLNKKRRSQLQIDRLYSGFSLHSSCPTSEYEIEMDGRRKFKKKNLLKGGAISPTHTVYQTIRPAICVFFWLFFLFCMINLSLAYLFADSFTNLCSMYLFFSFLK